MPSGHQIGPEKASSRLALVSADEREEQALLLAFSHGDVSAFETLFHLHQKAVFGWVLRIVRNPAAAEEITVESFWRIFRAHARLDPSRGFEPWARRIATHAALDHLRKQKPETDLSYEVPAPALADPAMTAEIRRKTAHAFARLPPKLRVAATLAVIEELPHKEIAEALGITAGAVKLRVFRALRILRKNLAQQGIKP
jgi:RNA polymerase sigma factor (sigma-70 family)